MKLIKASLVATIALILPFTSFSRNKDLMRANYYYSHAKYHDAIPYFEKIADDQNDPEIYAELADCYKYTSRVKEAGTWYSKAVSLEGCPDEIVLHFAQTLMELMQYDSAKKYLVMYQAKNKSDRRVANLIKGCEDAPEKLAAKPKGEVTFLNINTNGSEYAPTIWRNNLVFTGDADVDPDRSKNKVETFTWNKIYFVTCDRDGNTLKDLKRLGVKGVGDKEHMGPATFSADGKKMYYTVTKPKQEAEQNSPREIRRLPLEIMMATDLDSTTNEFQTNKPFKYNNKDYSLAHPTVSPDGKTLMFSSDMEGGSGGSDIYICHKDADGEWSKPVNAGKVINTEGEEVFPYLADNNTLFFSSDGHEGLGGLDVYMSKWDNKSHTFSTPVNLGTPINSSYDDISLALYADGRSSYFSSNRPALKQGDNLYFFNRSHAYLRLKLFDEVTNNPLNVAVVTLESGGEKNYITVDKLGEFVAPVYNDVNYKLTVTKNGYNPKEMVINTSKFKENDTVDQVMNILSLNTPKEEEKPTAEPPLVKNEPSETVRDSSYYRKPSYLIMTILDVKTKKAIKNATVTFESERDNREINANEKGKLFTQMIPEIPYTLTISKDGYISKSLTIKTVFGREEPDTVTEKVMLKAGKMAKKPKPTVKHEPATTDAGDEEATAQKAPKESDGHTGKHPHLVSLDGYYAEYNKSEIVESKKYILDSLVQMLKDNPKMRIRINGHADCRGSAAYNMKLSVARAVAVGKYLVSQGIDPKRLQHKGLGFGKPVVKCPVCNECSEEQHEKNRGFDYEVIK